jgi:hypothetical protein
MAERDLFHVARSAIAASCGGVTPRVRAIHLAVARNAVDDARKELERLEAQLKSYEAQLKLDGVAEP